MFVPHQRSGRDDTEADPVDEEAVMEFMAAKKRLEFEAALPYLKSTTIDRVKRGDLPEPVLRQRVRHAITTYLSDEERDELAAKRRTRRMDILGE